MRGSARELGGAVGVSARAFALELGDADFEREVMLLLSSRYAADGAQWSGEGLWTAYQRARKQAHRRQRQSPAAVLPDLYPTRSSGFASAGLRGPDPQPTE